MYADYKFYKSNWTGKVPKRLYNYVANKAQFLMDYYTFNRIEPKDVNHSIKLCLCELVDYIYLIEIKEQEDNGGRGPIVSETVDNWKVSYGKTITQQKLEHNITTAGDTAVYDICCKYLTQPRNFMYIGREWRR